MRLSGLPKLPGFIARNAKLEAERIGASRLRYRSYLRRERYDDVGAWISFDGCFLSFADDVVVGKFSTVFGESRSSLATMLAVASFCS